jgi:hypothetical protein
MRLNSVLVIAMCSVFLSASSPQSVSPATSQSIQAAAPERVANDTQRLTPGGAQLTVPAGWSIATQKNLVLLTPPEADTHLAIVDTQAPDARAAVTAAWLFDLETFRASGRKHNQRLCTPTTLIVVLGPPPIRHPCICR